MGIPTNEQNTAPGADGLNDWQKVMQGPFSASQRGADGAFKSSPGFVHTMTFNNAGASSVTFSVYDDATATSNAMDTVTVPAGSCMHVTLNAAFYNGLRVTCTSWTSALCSARYR